MKTPFLNDMALFVEVVKTRSFRAAAKSLGVPNSTLSRRISDLEKTIGLRLLNRTTRKIELTEAGQIYFERCKRIVDEAALAHEQLGEMLIQPSGLLRISLPLDCAITLLAPHLPEFTRRYPDITLDLDLTPHRVDLVSDSYDLAIRIGALPDSSLIARKLGEYPRYLYASPKYLQRAGTPSTPADLAQHECLLSSDDDQWVLSDGKRTVEIKVRGHYRLNSVGMMRRLAVLDAGIVVVAGRLVEDEVACGALRRVLPAWDASPVLVHAVTETRLLPAKTQHFLDFILEYLKA